MNSFEQKYHKYKKKYLNLKTIIQEGGGIGKISDISDKGDVTIVTNNQKNNRLELWQGTDKVIIKNYIKICNDPKKYIFVTASGSVYIYQGNIREGRITR